MPMTVNSIREYFPPTGDGRWWWYDWIGGNWGMRTKYSTVPLKAFKQKGAEDGDANI